MLALLTDLSEFVAWEGIGGDAYSRTFPGASKGYEEAKEVARDLDRAEELRPYRDLDPQRLKLAGSLC